MKPDFTTVTEVPGVNASQSELSQLYTRYKWASKFVDSKRILEVACGSGPGLGYFLKHGASSVLGTDVEKRNLKHAEEYYVDNSKIELEVIDAMDIPYEDESFDVIVNFEAIYYFNDLEKSMTEAYRILRSGGRLLISTVNSQWYGFNPSPFSHVYPKHHELLEFMENAGFATNIKVAFYDNPNSFKQKAIGGIRRIASKLGLIPKTMKGKERLKKIFYGELKSIPYEVNDNDFHNEELIEVCSKVDLSKYTFLYAEGLKT